MPIEIKLLGPGDETVLASVGEDVFDNPVDPALAREFLAEPRHHISVAVDDGVVVGFASGVDYVHPDKPRELWINEMGVASTHRGRGLGREILQALLDRGRELGCVEAWVLTERDNTAAMRLYASCGGAESSPDPVMFDFDLQRTESADGE